MRLISWPCGVWAQVIGVALASRQIMVDRSSVLRRTLVGEPGFPCKQFWLGNDGCIWWDMNYLHSDLKRQKVTQLKRGKWLDVMTNAVSISTLPPAGACLHQMVVDAPSHILAANI